MDGICSRFQQGPKAIPEHKHKDAGAALAQSQNHFARDMYTKLAQDSTGNLFFSPFSIMTALGMTLAGARGNTKAEMHKVMHLNDSEAVHDAFSDVVADIKREVPEYELRTANMAYISDQLNVLAEYAEVLTKKYMSSSETVDFNQEVAVRMKINNAVEKETNSRIKDLIPEGVLDSLTRMVLVNAVYFKGLWLHPFKESKTHHKDFWTSATTSVKVPMMFIEEQFGYAVNEDLGATLLRMKYQGSRLSMVFVLPNERDGLPALEAKLATTNLNELDKGMMEMDVEVIIPKFKLEESLDLENHLDGMGMVDLFDVGKADLSGITGSKDLYVSKVIHKAFLEVNEKGSEAAAATGMEYMECCLRNDPIFLADHPFLFYIRDHQSGFIYFVGRLSMM